MLLVGTFQPSLIKNFKRTASYTEGQFLTLATLLAQFRVVLTMPHLLTEVNGLANSLPEYLRPDFAEHFKQMAGNFTETLQPSLEIMDGPAFLRFGLADAALHHASKQALIITDDLRLAAFLRGLDRDVLTFREAA